MSTIKVFLGLSLITSIAFLSTIDYQLSTIYAADPTKVCQSTDNPYRPDSGCEQEVPYIHTAIDQYSLTKSYKPEVIPSAQTCDHPPSGLQRIPDQPDKYYVEVEITATPTGVELGGLGPNGSTLTDLSSDVLARHYLFNALGDKPLLVNSPRESFRTFWRLTSSNTIFNAKAKFLERYKTQNPPLFNSEFPYYDLACQGGSVIEQERPTSTTSEAKQHLFEPSCNGQKCYSYIINQALSSPRCDGKFFNPDLAIAIALNEDGGLVSDDKLGRDVKHFGCDPFCKLGLQADVPTKASCMFNSFTSKCSMTEASALKAYGYDSAGTGVLNVQNLNAIMATLGVCNVSAEKQNTPCFSVWVDKTTAQAKADYLNRNLPSQANHWRDYFIGFIQSFTHATVSCSLGSLAAAAPSSLTTGKTGVCSTTSPPSSSPSSSNARHSGPAPVPVSTSQPGSACGGGQIDTLQYIFPSNPNTILHMKNQENFQTYVSAPVEGRPLLVFNKQTDIPSANLYEEYSYDDQYIYHLRDTSWDKKCSNGTKAYYSLYDSSGKEGGPYMHRCVTPGASYTVSHTLKSFNANTCAPCANQLTGTAEAPTTSTYRVESKSGPYGPEIWVTTSAGSGAGETKVFAKGLGLIGFQNQENFKDGATDNVGSITTGSITPISHTCKPGGDYTTLPTFTLEELASTLPACLTQYPVCADYLQVYQNLPDTLKSKYDALSPFDFDSVRGYLAMGYVPYEKTGSKYEVQFATENLAYVQAVNDVLNDSSFGVVNALSPSWVNQKRQDLLTSSNIATNLVKTNAINQFAKEEKLMPSTYARIYDQLQSIFPTTWDNPSMPFWSSTPKLTLNKKSIEPHTILPGPETYPKELPPITKTSLYKDGGGFTQRLRIPVTLKSEVNTKDCDSGIIYTIEVDQSAVSRTSNKPLYDINGREISVFNNPLMTNITCSTSSCQQSLFKQFLTSSAQDLVVPTKYPIEGRTGIEFEAAALGSDIQASVKIKSDGSSTSPNIPRTDDAAHMNLCALRNLWFIPQNSQSIQPEECYKPTIY